MLAVPSAAALNHLLAQNAWAHARLARFAGKTVRFDIAPFSFACTVLADGTLRSTDTSTAADAVLVIPPSLLPRLVLRDERVQADIHAEGDAALLTEVFFLARNLRWDAAKDLGRVTGEVAAERIVQTARRQLGDATENLSKATAAYLTEEHPLLAGRHEVAAFSQQVDALHGEVARMQRRVERLVQER